MADSATFLAILTPALFDNSVTITLQSFNAIPNAEISSTTLISAGDSEQVIATKILNQLNADLIINGLNYSSRPVFSTDTPIGSWQANRSEHVLSIWSEAQFQLTVVDSGVGIKWKQGTHPMLLTLRDCLRIGPTVNQTFKDLNGMPLTENQILELIYTACGECTSFLHNPIVTRTWVKEEICLNTSSMYLTKFPIVDWDAPVIRRPNIFNVLPVTTFSDVTTRYAVNRKDGEVTFRFSQNLLFNYEPFDTNNDVKMSYRAGYPFIPEIVKEQVCRLSKLYERSSGIMSLGAGSSKIEFEDSSKHKRFLMVSLMDYWLEPGE